MKDANPIIVVLNTHPKVELDEVQVMERRVGTRDIGVIVHGNLHM